MVPQGLPVPRVPELLSGGASVLVKLNEMTSEAAFMGGDRVGWPFGADFLGLPL